VTINEARGRVTMLAECFLVEGVQPSVDLLTVALAQLARRMEEMDGALAQRLNALQMEMQQQLDAITAAQAALLHRFEVLAERERREHQPVSGRVRFTPGQAVRGSVSFIES
jgi:hypothetical protein